MKMSDIRKLSTKELTEHSTKLKSEIFEHRRKLRTGEVKNIRAVRIKRRDLARILTVLSEQLSKEANL